MSEPDSPTRGELHQARTASQQQLHRKSSVSPQNSIEERDDANNSIIGKVKSRVSSILPQKLTMWFSPSSPATGTISNGGVGRRRRRNEDEDREGGHGNNTDGDGSENSEDEDVSPTTSCPPSKRSRLNVEVSRTNFTDRQSFISSTPTTIGRQRITHLNLYGKHKEPAYNFSQTNTVASTISNLLTTNNSTDNSAADMIDLALERNLNTSVSSRRSLNIPSTSSSEGYRHLHNLKRQPMSSVRTSGGGNLSTSATTYTPQRSSTTIIEVDNGDGEDDDEDKQQTGQTTNTTIVVEAVDDDDDVDDNEESEEIAKVTSKPKKFTNGNVVGRSSSIATESGESRSSSVAQAAPPKSGLFNPASRDLRTLSGNGLNFYSHLEGRKSLFSEKNLPATINNSTLSLTSLNRRQFNSSIYGSTSALSDSRLLNTSSPFYKGPTTYGGAAAYNKFSSSLNPSVRIAPTRIRPTSSLSTLSSSSNSLAQVNDPTSTTISSTAKRILELINDFSSPLNDAKKMASSIKTPAMIASRGAPGKRFSEVDLANSRNMRLSTVRTPYSRPTVTLNPTNNDSKKLLPPIKELQVPSMSQLMQMKKMQYCTEQARQIAHSTPTPLSREYKLPCEENTSPASNKNANKHVTKVKQKVTSTTRVSSKAVNIEDEEAPPPVNLPNIPFPFMSSIPKIDISVEPEKSAAPAKSSFSFGNATKEAKPTNNFTFNLATKPVEANKPKVALSPAATSAAKPEVNFKFGSSASTSAMSTPATTTNSEFKFSSPLSLGSTPGKGDLVPINNFKFSSPVMVGGMNNVEKSTPVAVTKSPAPTTVPQLKTTGSVLDVFKKSGSDKIVPTTASPANKLTTSSATGISTFGDQFKKPSNEWECSVCMVRNKDTSDKCVACTTARSKPTESATKAPAATPQPGGFFPVKNTFGDAFKPKSDTWECSECLVRNKNDANVCVACNSKKPGAAGSTTAPSAKLQATDSGFKALVAQQTSSKWECDACMTRNDAERNKCVCCEQAKPGTQVVNDSMPKFSFGTSSASKFTFGFGNAGAKKEDELKAEEAKKSTDNKPGFTFGIPSGKSDAAPANTSTASASSTSGFTFGVTPFAKSTSAENVAGKDVPDVVKTNTIGFKFGVSPADSSKSDATDAATTKAAAAPTGFSFGIKSTDAKPSSVKFNLPSATTADSKTDTTSTGSAAVVSSTSSSATTAAPTTLPFSGFGGTSFGAPAKGGESKPAATSDDKKLPTAGFMFGVPKASSSTAVASTSTPASTSSSQPLAVNQPITFGSSSQVTETTKSPAKFVFGSSVSTTGTATSTSTTTETRSLFGKPAAVTTTSAPAVFSAFGSPASSSTSTGFKNTTTIFGASTTTSSSGVSTTVSSSSSWPNFNFGKPTTTTSPFGAIPTAAATSSTGVTDSSTSSMSGGFKPSSQFVADGAGGPSSSSSTRNSTISSTFVATTSAPASSVSSTPFVFGSSASLNASAPATTPSSSSKPLFGSSPFESGFGMPAAPAVATTTATSSWPTTNTISFGSSKPPDSSGANNPTAAPAPAFGSFVFGQRTSIFGSNQTNETKPAAAPIFGSVASTTPAAAAVASNHPPQSQQSTGNVFGSHSSTPIFGSMSFGTPPAAALAPAAALTNSNNLSAVPSFGSVGASSFSSGFGSLAASSSTASSSDGASAPKKSELAFNFTGAQNTGSTGGFAFGANNNGKPLTESAFKFSTGTTPNFNFTGSTESSATVVQPFQFGAPTNTPAVFNFGSVETTNSGGPFQFNAAAPAAATNNIFAPLPTQGSQATNQQAARRKIRTTIRRITPR